MDGKRLKTHAGTLEHLRVRVGTHNGRRNRHDMTRLSPPYIDWEFAFEMQGSSKLLQS
jgi:hypothetical protein